jgi:hypothetical protein
MPSIDAIIATFDVFAEVVKIARQPHTDCIDPTQPN